jgi:8-oxo-dGTP diphosphatase
VLEETGLEVRASSIVGLYSYEGQIPAIAVFRADVTGGVPSPLDETMDVKSFSRDVLPWAELAFPSTAHALRDYLADGGGEAVRESNAPRSFQP